MEPASLLVFAGTLLVAVAIPGPGIAALVARVLARGIAGAAAFTLGMWLGDLVWLAFAVGGLAVLAQSFHLLFLAVKWAGIGYLLWIAWKMWHAPAVIGGGSTVLPRTERTPTLLFAGFSLTMGNPKVMVFYLALLPSLVDLGAVDLLGYAELAAIVTCVLAVVFSGYMLLASWARALLTAPHRVRAINRGSALAICGTAGWVATR